MVREELEFFGISEPSSVGKYKKNIIITTTIILILMYDLKRFSNGNRIEERSRYSDTKEDIRISRRIFNSKNESSSFFGSLYL